MTMSINTSTEDTGESTPKRLRQSSELPPPPPPPQGPTPVAVAPDQPWQWEHPAKTLIDGAPAPPALMIGPQAQPENGPGLENGPNLVGLNGGPPPMAGNPTYTDLVKAEPSECTFCGEIITDRYIFQVASRSWHSHCLRCCVCNAILDSHTTCFLKDEQLYCKLDYSKMYGAKCYKCCRVISPTDWVRKARDQVYHLACFACDSCKRQLSTGEEFGISENKVLCKSHYMETVDGGCTSSDESGESDAASKKKTKRMRTTFTEDQIQILQANFQIDSNPDGQDLERIAQITGLSKRVTQVWFQNCRARQKKYMNSGKSRSQSKSVPLAGLSPIPRDQCSTPHQLDLHVMYSTFRAQPPPTAASAPPQTPAGESNSDDVSQDSTPPSGFMRSEV